MWIKICANTTLADARLAAELGADAVGFVFAPSPRQVTPTQIAGITPHLPATLEKVGVFTTPDPEQIIAAAREAGLTAIQLHSPLNLATIHRIADLTKGRLKIIQVLSWRIDAPGQAAILTKQLAQIAHQGVVKRVLIDSKAGDATGGTGLAFNWIAARQMFADYSDKLNLIVAGGLNPENVGEAISSLDPWGVDVASGVESKPGAKDPGKLAAFIRHART